MQFMEVSELAALVVVTMTMVHTTGRLLSRGLWFEEVAVQDDLDVAATVSNRLADLLKLLFACDNIFRLRCAEMVRQIDALVARVDAGPAALGGPDGVAQDRVDDIVGDVQADGGILFEGAGEVCRELNGLLLGDVAGGLFGIDEHWHVRVVLSRKRPLHNVGILSREAGH